MKNLIKNFNIPIPSNINYFWNFGSLLGLCLIIQIFTGIFLSFHYCNNSYLAFSRIIHITQNINFGWILRIFHANGASFFFIFIYLHISRGIFYNSFFFKKVWFSGIFIYLILIITAFLGYVLPWGQISFWGATVITNLLSAIPYIGTSLTYWIWGGFRINSATLSRFFSLHFLIPFLIIIFILSHIIFLHNKLSNNPLGLLSPLDIIPFNPFFIYKDILGYLFFFFFFFLINFYSPFIFIDPDNFSPANPLITPPHIQPEWYFLFAYAILRAIPNKLGGVIALLLRILILAKLSFNLKFYNFKFSLFKKLYFFFFCFNFIFLTYLGACPVEHPYPLLSQLRRLIYFSFFLFF